MSTPTELYSYYRSSCSYRVRIALNYKAISYTYKAIHLVNDGGEQHKSDYLQLNPKAEVPTLTLEGHSLAQSMAIFLMLDKHQPEPRLFPQEKWQQAQVIEFCEIINSGIQPLQNLSVLKKLVAEFAINEAQKKQWCQWVIERGFDSLEKKLKKTASTYCFGDQVSAADMFLVPQVYNAKRFEIDMSKYPTIQKVDHALNQLEAFMSAHPDHQPDTP